jgi:hypothetical protein
MNDLEKAARMALKGLERSESALHKARAALRQALEQPAQQEPVDWEAVAADQAMTIAMMKAERKPWVGLTEEERGEIACNCGCMSADWLDFARAIEAKLKDKNGY